jgi:hypothetical protein
VIETQPGGAREDALIETDSQIEVNVSDGYLIGVRKGMRVTMRRGARKSCAKNQAKTGDKGKADHWNSCQNKRMPECTMGNNMFKDKATKCFVLLKFVK